MHSTILILILGCTAFVAARPINTTDFVTDFSISGPLVPVDATNATASAEPTASINLTSPLDGVGENPLTGAAFLAIDGSADDAPVVKEAVSESASLSPTASAFELPGSPLSVVSVSSAPSITPTSAFELPGRPLSSASAVPNPTNIASIIANPGLGGELGAFSPNAFKRQVRTSASWRKRRAAEEPA